MIKFFRTIHQQLFTENKAGRYFKYAIIEILLVVIGILIALQINNWNENIKNDKTEIKYVKGILSNLDSDINSLEYNIARDTLRILSYTYVVRAFTDNKNDDSLLKTHLLNSMLVSSFSGQRTVFEDMKSSGKLNLIKSDSIRYQIQEYYSSSLAMLKRQDNNTKSIMNMITDISAVLDVNSIIEPEFEERFRAEIDDFDASFFNKDINEADVKYFANRISMMKGVIYLNLESHGSLLQKANQLKTDMIEYLSKKE